VSPKPSCKTPRKRRTGEITPDFPDKAFVLRCYSHKIEDLLEAAGLEKIRDADVLANKGLGRSWAIVKDWKEVSRYQRWSELQARKLYDAVNDPTTGVLPWIAAHW